MITAVSEDTVWLYRTSDHGLGWLILLRLYFEWIKLREELNEALEGFAKHSNNQIVSVDVMLSWFYGLALGAEHFTRYRRDRLLGELLGIERFGSPDTLRRLFLRFGYRQVTEVSERLMRYSLSRLRPVLMGHTLDLDSTRRLQSGPKPADDGSSIVRDIAIG